LCEAAKENGVKNFILASSSGTSAITETAEITDETYPQPVEILTKWAYYASKYYQEKTAFRIFQDKGDRLVILNPSLLLGAGDDRLSSTKVVLDFMAKKLPTTPSGGLNFVDARDAAKRLFECARQRQTRRKIFARRGELDGCGVFRAARKIVRRFRADASKFRKKSRFSARILSIRFIKILIKRAV
jgi:nucleoside-diphosphate-sugar epimerase